jgi:hypothetical protein
MSVADMTRKEKESLVIDLYKRNKTMNEIAQTVHMSFRDIGAITKKVQLQVERERGYINNEDEDEIDTTELKSPESKALKMFSEGRSPVQVAIALNLDAGVVRALLRDYCELQGKHRLGQIYENLGVKSILRLVVMSDMCRKLRMSEKDIENALDIAKHNELQNLQWKVEFLRNEINMLESKKNELLNLNRMKDEAQLFMAEKRVQMMENYYSNQGTGYSEPYNNTGSSSIRLSYSDYYLPEMLEASRITLDARKFMEWLQSQSATISSPSRQLF